MMRGTFAICALLLLLSAAFAQNCSFSVDGALKYANDYLASGKGPREMGMAKFLLDGKRNKIMLGNDVYYLKYSNNKISKIPAGYVDYETRLSYCTAHDLAEYKITPKEAYKQGLVSVKANNFFDSLVLGMFKNMAENYKES